MSGGSGGGNDTTVNTTSEPYAPAMPALNQIIGEAGTIYGAGPNYVAPNALTMEGLASQESMGRAANTQLADTVAGKYSNPFLSPIIQAAANDVYSGVASQFSGAGRTPGGVTSQQQVAGQIAQQAMPYAFQSYENERGRQLQTAAGANSLTSVGQTLEGYERQRQQAPYENLLQYANVINPVARGGAQGTQQSIGPQRNAFSSAAGGAMMGGSIGSMIGGSTGAMYGAGLGALGGLL
tara:strand:- start:1443 stop:2156 length:714 start_codon:yes stop_codon:yes gene_type:complete